MLVAELTLRPGLRNVMYDRDAHLPEVTIERRLSYAVPLHDGRRRMTAGIESGNLIPVDLKAPVALFGMGAHPRPIAPRVAESP